MRKNLFLVLLGMLLAACCAFGFAACGDGDTVPEHSHSWSQSWDMNETHHWHNCEAENRIIRKKTAMPSTTFPTVTAFAASRNRIRMFGRKTGKWTERTIGTTARRKTAPQRIIRKKTAMPNTTFPTVTAFAASRK